MSNTYTSPTIKKLVRLTPKQGMFLSSIRWSNRMVELAGKDNKEVGDFSGEESSIEDKAETFSDVYMH